ncbi:MAG: hypothetical protein LEGION0403_FIIPPAGN_01943 [Legionella sp.]
MGFIIYACLMIENALKLNPDIDSVVRMHNEKEARLLQAEIARNIGSYVLNRYDKLLEATE